MQVIIFTLPFNLLYTQECQAFLQEGVGTAVDDRRHKEVVHLARAISVRDLRSQVQAKCPDGTKIPSISWIRLQFCPKTPHSRTRMHYTGKFNVRFMVQARQFRKSHIDAHYAAAIFRYEREMSLLFRDKSVFVSLDDKHRIKIGEPGYPVSAVERGKRVMVTQNTSFEVGDHDFTKFSLVPSVCFVIDIPDTIEGSWYTGRPLVAFKDAVFEASSPQRHTAELHSLLVANNLHYYPILFLYSDGGSDHRLTYLSVQLSLISLFLTLDLDFLCACRTAPYHSWRNPVERLMSVVNLGLQSGSHEKGRKWRGGSFAKQVQ